MEISDELIACYVEGTCTDEELSSVRQYILGHPAEYERILCLIDNDKEDYMNEHDDDETSERKEGGFADIALSAAAFAPHQQMKGMKSKHHKQRCAGLLGRLDNMCNELDNI